MAYDPSEGLINGANLIGGLVNEGQKTQDYVSGMFDAHAKRQAGIALAQGDTDGAAGILGARGYLEQAQALKDRAAASSTLTSLAGKDYSAAKSTAAASGDPALYGAAAGAEQQDRQAKVGWLGNAASALMQIKDPDPAVQAQKRAQAFQQYVAPTMKMMGMTDEQLSAINGQNLTDEGLNAFRASLGQINTLSIQKMDDGTILGIDPKSGEVRTLHQGDPKAVWKEVKHADGSTGWINLADEPPGGGAPMGGKGAASGETPAPSGAIYDQIEKAATEAGAKPPEVAYLKRLGQVESNGDPYAKNGKSTGLFQFHPDTFDRLGGHDLTDVGDQTNAALALQRQDRKSLQSAGIAPTDANVYIMHQQGPAGGKALLTASPDAKAVDVLTPIYGSAKTATKAIVRNGGSADMTAGDFVSMWQKKWAGGAPPSDGSAAPNGATRREIPGSEAPKEDDTSLSDDAVEQAAERYITNGVLPALTRGKTGSRDRDRIMNKAADMERITGRTGAEAVAAWAGVKANAATLVDLTKTRGKVKSFEDNAIANADLALSLAPKGAAPLNVPVINRWIQTGRRAVAGDPNVTQFDIALGTFLDEYAKITSGATGGQGSTDASRREAYDRLSKYATQGQLAAGIATMKQEMGNRVAGLDKEIESTQAAISGGKGPPAAAATVSPRPEGWSKLLAPKQLATAKRFAGSQAPGGTQANPFVPTSQAQFDHLPSGAWFINPKDGKPMQKR